MNWMIERLGLVSLCKTTYNKEGAKHVHPSTRDFVQWHVRVDSDIPTSNVAWSQQSVMLGTGQSLDLTLFLADTLPDIVET